MRQFLAIITPILLSMSAAVPFSGASQSDALKIHLTMDASKYLLDQPIIVLACVENVGAEAYRDLPSLYAGDRNLRMTLTREPGNEVIPVTGMMREVVPIAEGLTLEPGGYQCEAVNLLDWFGGMSRQSNPLARAAWQNRLPAGQYRLEATLNGRTGLSKLSPVVVKSDAIRFQIRDDAQAADPFLRTFAARAPLASASREQFRSYCEQTLSQAYGSPYFFLVYYGSGMSNSSVPVDSILAGLSRAGVDPVRAAALLWLHAKTANLRDGPKLDWITRTKKRVEGNLPLKHVLDTWETRLKQKKYYYPAE